MSRYLTYTSPARGHLYPIVPTLLALRDRGHDIHVRTLASEVSALRDVGLNAAPLPAEIEALPLDDWKVDTPAEALDQCLRVLGERAELEIPDLRGRSTGSPPTSCCSTWPPPARARSPKRSTCPGRTGCRSSSTSRRSDSAPAGSTG